MTVNGPSEKPNTHRNGFIRKMVYHESDTMMNRSWNGYTFHVSPLSNGTLPSPQKCHRPPKFSNELRTNFSISYDGDESSQFDSLDSEPEYVTLDNNYFVRHFPPPSRHLSILDFKRNELNNTKTNSLMRHTHSQNSLNVKTPLKDKKWQKKSFKKLATNIGAVLSLSPRGDNLKRFPEEFAPVKRERSKSVGDLVEDAKSKREKSVELCLSDDDDNDDFGFLNYPKCSSSLSLAMNKAKSPSSTHKILPKRFRSKTRPVPVVNTTLWSPEGNCCWCNVSGRKVVLKPTSLPQLTEAERHALQKIVLSKLQAMNLGCSITIPKESPDTRRKRKVLGLKKKSHSANLGALIDKLHDKDKENKDCQPQPIGLVFGIPLAKCIANDVELQKRKTSVKDRTSEGDIVLNRRDQRKSSSSSHGSLDNCTQNGSSSLSPDKLNRCAASSDSLSESDCSRNTGNSSLVDALSLSTSRQGSLLTDTLPYMSSDSPQVPHIVTVCFKHLETYGLRVLGIFRVGASKKRVQQIRDEFDSGKDVHLDESHSPHDVGALLKVYFRDLPEPLLTRDLYTPLVATRRFGGSDDERLTAIQYLVSLLPVSNRDTLQSLLNFLAKVVEHSTDTIDADGETLPGNKMDAHNLATLFGPNILHKTKGSEKEFNVESAERAEESKEVIEVVKDMIDNYDRLFEVPAELRDEVLRLLLETDPDTADRLLKSLGSDVSIEPDPDTTSSSIYDDSDTTSIPRSPCSELDMTSPRHHEHMPLRNSKSEEMMSPRTRRRFFFSSGNNDTEKNDNNNIEKERPRFRLDRSPSPQLLRTPRLPRPPRVQVTKETSSPAVVRRHRSEKAERPVSENLSSSLAIPKPHYARQHSSSAINSNTSTTDNPVSSDGGQWLNPLPQLTPVGTPRTPRAISSRHRPLGYAGPPRSPRIPFENSEWERERWRQWEMLAKENVDDQYEKETLV